MARKTVRRSITMTQEMRDRLLLLASKQPRDVTEADLIRQSIRRFLDEQEDITGSRRHFQKSFRQRIDQLESALAFQMTVLLYLASARLDDSPAAIREAIITARRDGQTLLAQMQAVRDLKETK